MQKKIIIIGSGIGGLAAGIYGQLNGFDTVIFEAHNKPGGQCTSWSRKGYIFDPCVHHFIGSRPGTKFCDFWLELGALPCEFASRKEFVSAVTPDGTYFHDYYDLEKLESHMKQLSPEDAAAIDKFIRGIKFFQKDKDWFGAMYFGTFWEKLSCLPFMFSLFRFLKYNMGSFAECFKNPLLRKTIPLLHSSIPEVPLFMYFAEHASVNTGDGGWPKGGSLTISRNMAARYLNLGGTIRYSQKVIKILTENNYACGVELDDGTQHRGDFVVSNADGRKTIMELLSGRYMNKRIAGYCEPNPDNDVAWAVQVFIGVKRDLSGYPAALIMFLDKNEIIGGRSCDHLHMQIYGFDRSLAPQGKGVIKVELFGKPSYFSQLYNDKDAYRAEKERITEQVAALLEKKFPGLKKDIEITDVATLHSWERFMGGSQGYNNWPKKYEDLTDIRNVIDALFGANRRLTLPGLKNFFFAGQWATSMGSLQMNGVSGKTVIQKICRKCRIKFRK